MFEVNWRRPAHTARDYDHELWRGIASTYGAPVASALLFELAVDEDLERRAATEAVIRLMAGGPSAQTFLRRAVGMLGRSARARVRKKLVDYFPERQ